MNCNIYTSKQFERRLKKLCKRYTSMAEDYKHLVESLRYAPTQGTDLGNGLRKVRMAIKSKAKGKSGGARVITLLLLSSAENTNLLLLTIYDKSDRENIADNELRDIMREEGLC